MRVRDSKYLRSRSITLTFELPSPSASSIRKSSYPITRSDCPKFNPNNSQNTRCLSISLLAV